MAEESLFNDENLEDMLYFNGVNGTTGDYDLPPMSVQAFAQALMEQQELPADKNAAGFYRTYCQTDAFGPADDRDPLRIDQSGWGVIFAQDEDPAVIEALEPLLALRREQAGDFYYQYMGGKGNRRGYFPSESKVDFLQERGAEAFGPADPHFAPYYVLIVGDPEKIPFRFQYQLDVQYAVGRIHFRNPQEYAQYAQNVVMAETQKANLRLSRQAAMFGVEHNERDATYLSANHLVRPLIEQLQKMSEEFNLGWQFNPFIKEQATKANLSSLINGAQSPALLFTANHGMGFERGDYRQADHQGALLCQDWKGPAAGQKLEDCYFSADDVASNANLLGMMAFHFACFGAGTPRQNNFLMAKDWQLPPQIADRDFVARLPQQLMLKGALAVVGHIERAWGVSIAYHYENLKKDGSETKHLATYRSTLKRLMDGHPIGSALEYFNEKYGEYSAALSQGFDDRKYEVQKAPDDYEFTRLWRANNDARNFIILGDPAVRLPLAGVGETPIGMRPPLKVVTVSPPKKTETPPQPPPLPPASPTVSEEDLSQPKEQGAPYLPQLPVNIDFAEKDPELYAAWRKHMITGFEQNSKMFARILNAFMGAYDTTVLMYKILFGVGIAAFLAAAILSAVTQQTSFGLIFGGLSVASFLSYFLSRPLKSLEQNLQFITWLGVLYNTYWTRLMYMLDIKTVQKDLAETTDDTVANITALIDKYAEMHKQRSGLQQSDQETK